MMLWVLYLLFAQQPQAQDTAPCTTTVVVDYTVTVDGVAVPYCRESGWEREE